MEFNTKDLREKINQYFAGNLEKEELGKWASYAYYDLLKGGYTECEKMVLYPFIKTVSQIHVKGDDIQDIHPCSKSEVEEVRDVLNGKKPFDFALEVAIPEWFYTRFGEKVYCDIKKRELIFKIREGLSSGGKEQSPIAMNTMDSIGEFSAMEHEDTTLQGMLENHIARILRALFDVDCIEKTNLKVCPQTVHQETLTEKLLSYIDYYLGTKIFYVLLSYKEGVPDLMILA